MNAVHREYLELAASAIDFELSDTERVRLDAHVEGCDVCRRRVAALRLDDVQMATLPSFGLGAEAIDRLRPDYRPPPRFDMSMLRLVLIAVLLATVVLASLAIGAEVVRREVERRLAVVPPAPVTLPAPSARSVPRPVAFGDWRSIGPVDPLVNGQVQLGCYPSTAYASSAASRRAPDGAGMPQRGNHPTVWHGRVHRFCPRIRQRNRTASRPRC